MRADLSLIELILDQLCGIGRTSRAQEQRLTKLRAPSPTVPTSFRIVRYRLSHGCFTLGRRPDKNMKDPRSIPAVSSPDPENCMCCWYQQFYNPTRPSHLLGLVGYGCLLVVVRLFPPMKPDEVNGICEQHIEVLYPPRRVRVARATSQSSSTLAATGDAQPAGVGV